jgi:hypothetical protein
MVSIPSRGRCDPDILLAFMSFMIIIMFPSPLGERVIQTLRMVYRQNGGTAVSIPSRGKGDPDVTYGKFQLRPPKFPSPLGERVIQTSFGHMLRVVVQETFPSPLGERVIQTPRLGGLSP